MVFGVCGVVRTCSVAVVVVDWCAGTVDGELLEVGAAVTVELGVEVGEETALQEGVLGEVDTADDMARLELRNGISITRLVMIDRDVP